VVGKTNLHELAFGVTGINPWFGTPTNPLDPTRVPGGSSSGSAVAVATGEADVAYGTDTGGSIRIPSACCGTAGLKTTWGRISLDGVWPVAPEFDTIGPMARDVAGVVTGMELLEPGFAVAAPAGLRIGRIRISADPEIDAALDTLLSEVGWEVVDVDEAVVAEWNDATMACGALLVTGSWNSDHHLIEAHPDEVGAGVAARMQSANQLRPMLPDARVTQHRWSQRLRALFDQVDLLATPTLSIFAPRLEEGDELLVARCTLAVNLAGVPALSIPVPSGGPLPASLQLIGPWNAEDRLLAAGLTAEACAGAMVGR